MTELIPFDFNGASVRVVTIDGEPWFIAADVCRVLGIRDTHDATRGLDDDEKGTDTIRTPGGLQSVTIVSESGLYSLILRSRKPEARRFKRWITSQVLPAIRKTGRFSVEKIGRRELAQMVIEAEDRAELAEKRAAELEPAANSWELLADASGDYALREAAQILDRDPRISTGQNRLSKYLREIGWADGRGMPYQREVDLGRLAVRASSYPHPSTGEDVLTKQLRITAKGLHELHRRMGGQGPLLLAA